MYKDPFENLVSLEQAAALWNMEVNEIVKLAESEKINAKKFDNVWIIDKRKDRKNLQRNSEKRIETNAPELKEIKFAEKPLVKIYEEYNKETNSYYVVVNLYVRVIKKTMFGTETESLSAGRYSISEYDFDKSCYIEDEDFESFSYEEGNYFVKIMRDIANESLENLKIG